MIDKCFKSIIVYHSSIIMNVSLNSITCSRFIGYNLSSDWGTPLISAAKLQKIFKPRSLKTFSSKFLFKSNMNDCLNRYNNNFYRLWLLQTFSPVSSCNFFLCLNIQKELQFYYLHQSLQIYHYKWQQS